MKFDCDSVSIWNNGLSTITFFNIITLVFLILRVVVFAELLLVAVGFIELKFLVQTLIITLITFCIAPVMSIMAAQGDCIVTIDYKLVTLKFNDSKRMLVLDNIVTCDLVSNGLLKCCACTKDSNELCYVVMSFNKSEVSKIRKAVERFSIGT